MTVGRNEVDGVIREGLESEGQGMAKIEVLK